MKEISPLQGEIVKLLANGPMHAGEIRNRLNGSPSGLDITQDDVLSELRRLDAMQVIDCVWRLNPNEMQTPVPFVPTKGGH
jgi:hypothetical protein